MGRKIQQPAEPSRRLLFRAIGVLAVVVVAVVGLLAGLIFGYALELPQVNELEAVRPGIISYVYADDGRILGQFALERRILVSYEEIPASVRQAILAAEDANFFNHSGIDVVRFITALFRDVLYGELKGASTLTMQLSKLRFTSYEKTPERKIKDILFALEIEQRFSKEQIFTLYCNQVYLGHGVYGVAAAAEFYFNKHLSELTVPEAALLAGILPNPTSFSPLLHPDRARIRRAYALRRMAELGYIDRPSMEAYMDEPMRVQSGSPDDSMAPYFVEWVRQYLQRKYDTDAIWQSGLRVYTTIDYDMQLAATQALREGLKRFDRQRKRWSGAAENIREQGLETDEYFHQEWRQFFFPGQMIHGLILQVTPEKALVRFGSYTAEIGPEQVKWTERSRLDQVLKVGDITPFLIEEIDRETRTVRATLDRIPEVQGAILAIDNRTGAIRAMEGGFDFRYSKFNRATQALRQPGSIFKPFTYVAALEAGYSPSDEVQDVPVTYFDDLGRPYEPKNADGEFLGLMPIRKALALSRNVPTIRLAHAIGIARVIDAAHRFGARREFPPYLPIALGAGEVTLEEITSAFTAFPNRGVRPIPHFIKRVEDYNGVVLEEHRPNFEEVISPEVAEKMLYLLRGVVEEGTATQARVLGRPLGGKTGTTNDYTDSWFVGFTPQLTAGVWAGHDEKVTLGNRVYGATLALPIWIEFMKGACHDLPVEDFQSSYRPPPASRIVEAPRPPEVQEKLLRGSIVVEDIKPPE